MVRDSHYIAKNKRDIFVLFAPTFGLRLFAKSDLDHLRDGKFSFLRAVKIIQWIGLEQPTYVS